MHRHGHGALQRALKLRVTLRNEPDDRIDPVRDPGTASAAGQAEGHGAGQDRTLRRLSDIGPVARCVRPDLCRARQRDLSDEPEPTAAFGACGWRLDRGKHCKPRDPGDATKLLSAGSFTGRILVGSCLRGRWMTFSYDSTIAVIAVNGVWKSPGFQIDVLKFQGGNSSMRFCGWPAA